VSLREFAAREAFGAEVDAARRERDAIVAFLLTLAEGLSYADRVRLNRICTRIQNNEHRNTKC